MARPTLKTLISARAPSLAADERATGDSAPESVALPGGGPRFRSGSRFWRRFRNQRLGMVSVVVLLLLILMALFAPFITAYHPYKMDLEKINQPPDGAHFLGYDNLGRDIWTRLVYGTRVSLSVGVFAVAIYTIIGVAVGSIAGFFGGTADMLIMRFTDIMMCFPSFLLIVTVAAALGPSLTNIILIIGLLGWTGISRLVRAQILSVREQDYVLAARCTGVTSGRILVRHVMPNALTPVLVSAPLGIAGAILTEAGLSFLGIGVQDPIPSWGGMMTVALSLPILQSMPWRWLPPAVMLSLTTLSTNFAADALRDAIDPRMRLD